MCSPLVVYVCGVVVEATPLPVLPSRRGIRRAAERHGDAVTPPARARADVEVVRGTVCGRRRRRRRALVHLHGCRRGGLRRVVVAVGGGRLVCPRALGLRVERVAGARGRCGEGVVGVVGVLVEQLVRERLRFGVAARRPLEREDAFVRTPAARQGRRPGRRRNLSSSAPASHREPCGREIPRWSYVGHPQARTCPLPRCWPRAPSSSGAPLAPLSAGAFSCGSATREGGRTGADRGRHDVVAEVDDRSIRARSRTAGALDDALLDSDEVLRVERGSGLVCRVVRERRVPDRRTGVLSRFEFAIAPPFPLTPVLPFASLL